MKNILTYLLVFLCCLSISQAQNGGIANNWYFGQNAGINFNTGSPTAMLGPINTLEGCATISDVNGNLLFSTDGDSVYNSNNLPMPNGFGLWGNWTTTQSALIVPNPGNINQYYIFTAAAQAGIYGGYDGIAYSIVDMTLDGGLGDVMTKNLQLLHPAVEKLTAIRHCNGTDYWVICHEWNSDAFYAYQVNSSGVNAPIISHVGSNHYNVTGSGYNNQSTGCMKASPNGKKLAVAIYEMVNYNVELFDFNNATGTISNNVSIFNSLDSYGLAFSPDNTKLYVGDIGSGALRQYDLTAGNALYTIGPSGNFGTLQLGPDGKIYIANVGSNYLGVINNPNIGGIGCNYLTYGVHLISGSSYYGLPNFIDNVLNTFTPISFSLGPDDTLCSNTTLLDAGAGWGSYLWSTDDTSQSISVSQTGSYWIEVLSSCGNILRDTINIYLVSTPVNLGNDTTLCNGASLILDAGAGGSSYLWSTGDTSSTISVNSDGIYWVTETDICGSSTDTIVVSPTLHYLPDTFVCKFSTVTLNAASGYNTYQWNTGDTTQSIIVNQAGQYDVTMTTNNGCIAIDSLTVAYNPNTVPNATFTATANNNMNGTFTSNFTYTSAATNLQSYWNFGDGTSTTTTLPSPHIYLCGQDYLVQHIISNECGSDTFDLMINAPCQVAIENPYQLSFTLYPNPLNQSTFYIDIENRNENEIQFYLYDLIGKSLFSETLKSDKNRLELPANLANGVYIAKVIDTKNNRIGNIKFTIMK